MPDPDARNRPGRRGYIILATLIAAMIVVFNLHVIRDALRPTLDLVALVDDAPGVRVGSAVRVEGVKAGEVKGVEVVRIDDSTYVALGLRLDGQARAVVTRRSDVRSTRDRFIGEPLVRIYAGAPGDPPIRDGDTIRGQHRIMPEMLAERATDLPAALAALRAEADTVLGRLDRRRPELQRLVRQYDEVSRAASVFAARAEGGSLARIMDPDGLPLRVAGLRARMERLSEATADLVDRYAGDDAPIAAALERVALRARDLDLALAELEARGREGGGVVFRMQEDTAIQVAVRGIQAQIDSLRDEAFTILWRMYRP